MFLVNGVFNMTQLSTILEECGNTTQDFQLVNTGFTVLFPTFNYVWIVIGFILFKRLLEFSTTRRYEIYNYIVDGKYFTFNPFTFLFICLMGFHSYFFKSFFAFTMKYIDPSHPYFLNSNFNVSIDFVFLFNIFMIYITYNVQYLNYYYIDRYNRKVYIKQN